MHIGILQAGHSPQEVQDTLGEYDAFFRRVLEPHGLTCSTWSIVDNVAPPQPTDADGWLITGSKHGVYEELPWIPVLEDLIRAIHAAGRPLVGVCFGHQIIAQALGGRVEKFTGGWSIGRQVYTYQGREIAVNAWHQDQVLDLPPEAKVTMTSDFCAHAGFVVGDTVWTVQSHPEIDSDMVEALAIHRAPGVVPPALIEGAKAQLDAPTDRLEVIADIAAFFKKERAA